MPQFLVQIFCASWQSRALKTPSLRKTVRQPIVYAVNNYANSHLSHLRTATQVAVRIAWGKTGDVYITIVTPLQALRRRRRGNYRRQRNYIWIFRRDGTAALFNKPRGITSTILAPSTSQIPEITQSAWLHRRESSPLGRTYTRKC